MSYDPTENIPAGAAGGSAPATVDPDGSPTAATPSAGLADGPATLSPAEVDENRADDIASGNGCVVALRFRDPLMAQEALLAAIRLRTKGRLGLQDAAIVAKESGGRVRIQQTKDLDTIQGASSGLWLGVLAGLFVPGGVLIGGALGAAVGGLWAKLRDIGISDKRMKELGDELPEGEVALFMLVDDAHRYHALAELRRFPATLFYSTLGAADRASVTESLASGIVDEGF